MVIDSSALVAILAGEPEQAAFIAAIEGDGLRLMSAASYLEASIVIEGRYGADGRRDFDQFIAEAAIEVAAVTREQAEVARDVYRIYGRGNHPARLNFGDCFAYALAQLSGETLLCKGNDFAQTDLVVWTG